MDAYYKVSVTYPNGKTEEIEENFKTGQDALGFGKTILGQIPHNQGFHESIVDEFGGKHFAEPYFMIIKIDGKKHKIVYDSRYPD